MFLKTKQILHLSSLIIFVLVIGVVTSYRPQNVVHAADNNFADGITVDSSGDGADANLADSICDDGSGNCTLRAAIEESNNEAGTQTINFNISGTADFTNSGQNGYTIQISSNLPDISDVVIIDGYSQPGAQANTAVAPNPLNGILLIEIDGTNSDNLGSFEFTDNSNNSELKGLVINNFDEASAVLLLADNVKIQGNYIGTDPTGLIAVPNSVGVNAWTQNPESGHDAIIGGLLPAERNLISGNTANGGAASGGYPGDGWIIQGNYIGVGADGLTPIPNSSNGGSGALSIDDCNDVVIGGNQPGAINVIGASLGHGIAPYLTSNLLIEGNYVGLGYDGTTVLGNFTVGSTGGGLVMTNSINPIIKNNRFAGWEGDGIYIGTDNSGVIVEGNTSLNNNQNGISAESNENVITENTISSNTLHGILINSTNNLISDNSVSDNTENGINLNSSDNTVENNIVNSNTGRGIGISQNRNNIINNNITDNILEGIGISSSENNLIYNVVGNNHGTANISIVGFPSNSSNIIQGNKIGVKPDGTLDNSYVQNIGIAIVGDVTDTLIGGNISAQANVIAGNSAAGIVVSSLNVTGLGNLTSSNNTIIGNSIHSNDSGTLYGFNLPGLGIDLVTADFDNTFTPQAMSEDGPNPNDSSDPDTGANNYLNFPVINSTSATAGQLSVNYNLDVDDSATGYRVEFFANSTADPSGFGEGQIYLGSTNVPSSTNNATANLNIPSNFTSGTYAISATTTEIDNSTDGFGSTSEFSAVLGSQIILAGLTSTVGVPNTGLGGSNRTIQDIQKLVVSTFIITGVLVIARKRRSLSIK